MKKTVGPVSLCEEKHYKELRRGIARTFRDGMGEICFFPENIFDKFQRRGDVLLHILNIKTFFKYFLNIQIFRYFHIFFKGEVTCCFSNGCNLSLQMARESLVRLFLSINAIGDCTLCTLINEAMMVSLMAI